MKRHVQWYAQWRAVVLAMALGSVSSLALAQAQPSGQSPLARFGPFNSPSAAGEMYLLRQAGLLPALPEGGAAPAVPSPASGKRHRPGIDVIVNNPAEDTDNITTQSETTLAVRGKTICAGYNDSGPNGLSGFSRSTDLGTTWIDQGGIGQGGDPVLAVSQSTGTFYYAEIATIVGRRAIGVARSNDDCQSFTAAVNASPIASGLATGPKDLNDKPWIAVDNTKGGRDGNIYVCWTSFIGATSELRFSRSIDGGATYQDEQVIAPNGTSPFGCSVGVGPGGEVYVAWADRSGATANDIRFRRSTNGGLNFDPVVTVSTGNRQPGTDRQEICSGVNRLTLNGDIRMLHQAWLAVDTTGGPSSGNIYVTWASDPVGAIDNSDVFFSRSTDGGAHWAAKVQLGAGGGATDQFEPFVAVGGNGAVSVAWYDRRRDPANNNLIDVFKTLSTNGGTTFGPLIRVTDVNFPVPPLRPNFDPSGIFDCYMGEYIATTADAKNFYYAWGDNRNIVVNGTFPAGRPDPDVFFDSEKAPIHKPKQ